MNKETETKAPQLTRPDYQPGDMLRRVGTTLVGSFLGWSDKWPDYVRVICPGRYVRVEPAYLWEPA